MRALIDTYGAGLLGDPTRLRGLLSDEVPQGRRENSVLLLALEARVPQDLLRVQAGEPLEGWTQRLVRRLSEEWSLSAEASRWAVSAWAHGLGLAGASHGDTAPAGADGAPGSEAAAADTAARGQAVAGGLAAGPRAWFARMGSRVPRRLSRGQALVAAAVGLTLVALAGLGVWLGTSRLEIVSVQVPAPFVGNGKPVPVALEVELRHARAHQVAVRLVEGDGPWPRKSWQADLTPDPARPRHLSAGTLQVQATKPLTATFEFTLIAADGQRSVPFRHQVAVVPPLLITRVDLPRLVPLGRAIEFGMGFQKSAAAVVRLERRVVHSSVPIDDSAPVQALTLGPDDKVLRSQLPAFSKPTQATMEFILVDAAGVRSEPFRVTVHAGNPPPPPGTGPGTVTAVRSLGNRFGLPSFRKITRDILDGIKGKGGSADSGDATAGGNAAGSAGPGYETTVRLDDGSTRVVTTPGQPPWQVGSRVRWNGTRLTLLQ